MRMFLFLQLIKSMPNLFPVTFSFIYLFVLVVLTFSFNFAHSIRVPIRFIVLYYIYDWL